MMLDYHYSARAVAESDSDTVLLPIGSTEQHGDHLPIGTDFFIAQELSKEIAGKLGCFLLPTLPISTCREHQGKKGSVWISPDLFFHVIQDIVRSLYDQGFRKVILLLSHGGIFVAGPAIRELNLSYPDLSAIRVDLMQFFPIAQASGIIECDGNLHACEFETSLMLYLKPELVHMELAQDFIPDAPREFLNYASMLQLSPCGVWGKPSLATAAKGESLFRLIVDGSVDYVKRTFAKLDGVRAV